MTEMATLFQDHLYDPCQVNSVKDPYSNYPQFISVASQQLDIPSYTDLLKRIEAFTAIECACGRLFVKYGI
jgi:hypothetical protein